MSPVPFYATKEDLIALLQFVESKGALRYTLTGNYLKSETEGGIEVFNTGTAIPDLGKASADSSVACDTFLVCKQETPIHLRTAGSDGERICVDQLANPDSVTFTPGGVRSDDVVLEGRIATASDSAASVSLMKQFRAATRQLFTKVRSRYVGPQALTLLRGGGRLTGAVQSPTECDLTLPSSTE